jgi:1-deoxy-D-xylulose-5-phosphate synthase
MGMRYLGPIDGHNLPLLISTLEFAKTCDHPIVIHILTQKGKGFEAALKFRKNSTASGLTTPDRRNARRQARHAARCIRT